MEFLSAAYPIWFCDIWGVVHNGYTVFAAPCSALSKHRAAGGVVILVTNSPRTSAGVEKQLDDIGVSRDAYDAVVTSGDVTRTLMIMHGGGKIFHLGPKRDVSIFAGLNLQIVPLAEARSVLCTGLFDETTETPQDYGVMLAEIKALGLPFICANPDKVVRKGSNLISVRVRLPMHMKKLAAVFSWRASPSNLFMNLR